MRRSPAVLAACLVTVFAAGCGTDSTTGSGPDSASVDTAAGSSPSTSTDDAAVAECRARPSMYDELLLRLKDPGLPWTSERLGGQWSYNHTTNTCQNGVDFLLASIADEPGYCGQVARAEDNPNYKDDTTPAAPLKKIIAQKGRC